jgi:hypothetical protein
LKERKAKRSLPDVDEKGKENVILAWWLVTYIEAECAAERLSETNSTARSA